MKPENSVLDVILNYYLTAIVLNKSEKEYDPFVVTAITSSQYNMEKSGVDWMD